MLMYLLLAFLQLSWDIEGLVGHRNPMTIYSNLPVLGKTFAQMKPRTIQTFGTSEIKGTGN
jgi:hypothetical protein